MSSAAPVVLNGKEHRPWHEIEMVAETKVVALAPKLAALLRDFADKHDFTVGVVACRVELRGVGRLSETERGELLAAADELWGVDVSLKPEPETD